MTWKILAQDGALLIEREIASREEAERLLEGLPSMFRDSYMIVHRSGNAWVDRVLTEGLVKGDLQGILLPRLSVDEYVPGDPNTDNVVLAFFIKGVPEAVIPFKNFCEHCNGVINVDYGDSDTIPDTSIVYVEMDRETMNLKDIEQILDGACRLATFEIDDITLTFPHTQDKFPFRFRTLQVYFRSRDRRKNQMAQRKAEKQADIEAQKIVKNVQQNTPQEDRKGAQDDGVSDLRQG